MLQYLTHEAVQVVRRGQANWEYKGIFQRQGRLLAVCVFPGEQYQAPRSWIDRAYPNLIYYNQVDKREHL